MKTALLQKDCFCTSKLKERPDESWIKNKYVRGREVALLNMGWDTTFQKSSLLINISSLHFPFLSWLSIAERCIWLDPTIIEQCMTWEWFHIAVAKGLNLLLICAMLGQNKNGNNFPSNAVVFLGYFLINEESMRLLRQTDSLQKEFHSPLNNFLHFSENKTQNLS